MFGSLFGLVEDTVKIATAPIEIAVEVTRVVTKPLADVAEEIVEGVKNVTS